MTHRRTTRTPIDRAATELQELQDHQYLPGYYTQGEIPPVFRAQRPNPYGYALLFAGGLAAAMLVLSVVASLLAGSRDLSLGSLLTVGAPALLMLVTGFRLQRAPRSARRGRAARRRGGREARRG